MYKFLLFIILSCCSGLVFGQHTLQGRVITNLGAGISDALIENINTGNFTTSNKSGKFELLASLEDTLRVTHAQFERSMLVVDFQFNVEIVLYKNDRELKEVAVTSQRLKTVLDRENENILDFLFVQENLLTLVKEEKAYKLKLFYKEKEQVYVLPFDKPSALYQDYYENLYVLTKDTAYLVTLDSYLGVLATYEMDKFEMEIKPIAYDSKDVVLLEQVSALNKRYELVRVKKSDFDREMIYVSYDKIGERSAAGFFQDIVCLYYNTVSVSENVIENGIWNGDMIQLAVSNDLLEMVSWYEHIDMKQINVHSLPYKNELMVFDFNNLQLVRVNTWGEKASEQSVVGVDEKEKTKMLVLRDDATDNFYLYNPNDAVTHLRKLQIDKADVQQVLKLTEVTYPEKLIVYDGWLYVLEANDSGFKKLYRIKLV